MHEFRLRFHWSLFLRFELTIFQHWFRWWLGAVQATSHYLNQWWLVYWRIYASLSLNELNGTPVFHHVLSYDWYVSGSCLGTLISVHVLLPLRHYFWFINTLNPRQSGRHFADVIFTFILLCENSCIFLELWYTQTLIDYLIGAFQLLFGLRQPNI